MPGGFPLGLDISNGQDYGTVAASSVGTTITAGSTSNTKGSFTQITASTSFDCCWMIVSGQTTSTAPWAVTVDIAIGPSGSEQVILSDLIFLCPTIINGDVYELPISIPAGTRISARAQSDTASATVLLSVIAFDGAFTNMEGCAGADSIGYLTASSTGTVITPSATANTKGSYSQLIASTSRDYIGFLISIDSDLVATTDGSFLLDIAIGPSGSEQVIIPNLPVCKKVNTAAGLTGAPTSPIFIAIPSGTRIAARSQFDSTGQPPLGLTLYGLYI